MLDPKLHGFGGGFKELGSTENCKETKSAFQRLIFPEKLQGPKTAVVVLGLWGLNGYLNTGSITGYDWFARGINHNFFPPPSVFLCLPHFSIALFFKHPHIFLGKEKAPLSLSPSVSEGRYMMIYLIVYYI